MSGSDKQTPSSRPSHCMFLTAVTAMNESDEPKKLVSGWGSEKKVRLAKPGKLSLLLNMYKREVGELTSLGGYMSLCYLSAETSHPDQRNPNTNAKNN